MTLRRLLLLVLMTATTLVLSSLYPVIARGAEWLSVRWQHPWFLFGLLLLPVVYWASTFGRDHRLPRLLVGTTTPAPLGPKGVRAHLRDFPGVLRTVALGLFIIALARPVTTVRPTETTDSGIDIVLVLDLSGSMKAVMDGKTGVQKVAPGTRRPTRLDVAKEVIRDFIGRRKTDRIGAVVFGRSAFVLSPPTLDYQLLDQLISKIELDMIDPAGTAIGDALGVASARMRRSDARSKAIVLLTDGDSNSGSIAPDYGAHLATTVGAKVYSIQIGDGGDVDVQEGIDGYGNPKYVRANYPVNPELLKRIAQTTAGEFYMASDATSLRKSMHSVLDKLEKTKFEAQLASFEDLFPLVLLPGVVLLVLDALLRAWVLRRFP